jgi:phage shock protein A
MSLDTLQSSATLFPDRKEQKLEELDDKVTVLEIKIKTLTQEKNSLIFSDITKEVSDELEKIDSELAKCFRGAIRTLEEDRSEDLVAQVAESLTRVVENLPFKLAQKGTKFIEKKKSTMITNAMKEYL